MHPVIVEFDLFGLLAKPFSLHSYGLLIAAGFLSAMMLSKRQGEREGEDPDQIVDLAFYLLLSGLVGARIVFILTKWQDYVRNPAEIVMFWRGGLVFYGGFIGAGLFMAYYCRRHRINFFKYADIYIPYLAMAHAFGRLGCLAAGCCFGKVTEASWGIIFPLNSMVHQAHVNMGVIGLSEMPHAIHPTQLYEAGAEICMFLILAGMRKYKRFHGQLFLIWLSAYPVIRSFIEMFRGDKVRGLGVFGTPLSTSQFISVVVALVAVYLYFYLRRQRTKAAMTLSSVS